jgi:hypothetical protein
MSGRMDELAERRAILRARCARQRGELGIASYTLQRQLGAVDRGLYILRRVASAAPLIIGGAIAIAFLVGPGRLLRWTGQAALLVSTMKRLTRG